MLGFSNLLRLYIYIFYPGFHRWWNNKWKQSSPCIKTLRNARTSKLKDQNTLILLASAFFAEFMDSCVYSYTSIASDSKALAILRLITITEDFQLPSDWAQQFRT